MKEYLNLRASIALGLVFAFLVNTLGPMPLARAQELILPQPGIMVPLSLPFNPPILKGLKVHPDNPLRFDFILDQGDTPNAVTLKQESTKLIKYFLASLTVPEKDLWVNLSPYEKNRIVPQSFGLTEMGRDLLAEDYMLKQITASLIYPEESTGQKFWKRVYAEAARKFGTTNIPVNTFNKVWIVPEKAVVYENAQAGTAYVVESKLKVMLEQDYISLSHHVIPANAGIQNTSTLGSQIIREIVIPELTKEVNEDRNFSQLRQVYNSLILATWYKRKLKDSILSQVYADKNKVAGVNSSDPQEKQRIYERYLQAFKKGVYNYIKEDIDPATQQPTPRKYFSGGMALSLGATDLNATSAMKVTHDSSMINFAKHNLLMIGAAISLAIGPVISQGQTPPSKTTTAAVVLTPAVTFAPADNKVLLMVGQYTDGIERYVKNVGIPAGFMTYTSIQNLEGLGSSAYDGNGSQYAQSLVDRYPDTVLQIGLRMMGAVDDINAGKYDANIKKLGDWIKQTKRPVFLRIGYEFDYPGNKYDPKEYKKAYIRIADQLRRVQGVGNVSFVWHSVSYGDETFERYYPGNEYVDWVGMSYFNKGNEEIGGHLAYFAAALGKPLMIAEASAWNTAKPSDRETWFKGFFNFVHQHHVKAISYINSNWDEQPLFQENHWGDASVENDPKTLKQWDEEISKNGYLNSSTNLFDQIHFKPDHGMKSGASDNAQSVENSKPEDLQTMRDNLSSADEAVQKKTIDAFIGEYGAVIDRNAMRYYYLARYISEKMADVPLGMTFKDFLQEAALGEVSAVNKNSGKTLRSFGVSLFRTPELHFERVLAKWWGLPIGQVQELLPQIESGITAPDSIASNALWAPDDVIIRKIYTKYPSLKPLIEHINLSGHIHMNEDLEQEMADLQEVLASKDRVLVDQVVTEALNSLTESQKAVMSYRFGFEDGKFHTLEETGERYKLTRERIRQIEAKSLRRLRHPTRIRAIIDAMESSNDLPLSVSSFSEILDRLFSEKPGIALRHFPKERQLLMAQAEEQMEDDNEDRVDLSAGDESRMLEKVQELTSFSVQDKKILPYILKGISDNQISELVKGFSLGEIEKRRKDIIEHLRFMFTLGVLEEFGTRRQVQERLILLTSRDKAMFTRTVFIPGKSSYKLRYLSGDITLTGGHDRYVIIKREGVFWLLDLNRNTEKEIKGMGVEFRIADGSWLMVMIEGDDLLIMVPTLFKVTYEANDSSIIEKSLIEKTVIMRPGDRKTFTHTKGEIKIKSGSMNAQIIGGSEIFGSKDILVDEKMFSKGLKHVWDRLISKGYIHRENTKYYVVGERLTRLFEDINLIDVDGLFDDNVEREAAAFLIETNLDQQRKDWSGHLEEGVDFPMKAEDSVVATIHKQGEEFTIKNEHSSRSLSITYFVEENDTDNSMIGGTPHYKPDFAQKKDSAQSAQPNHLSQEELALLKKWEKDPTQEGFVSKWAREDDRIRHQIIQIESALGHAAGAESKADQVIADLNDKKFKFKGEEVHILDGTGSEAKVIGRIDRNIAEKYGYIHETANVVLLTPDGKVLLQMRNKENSDDHLAMYGGHLGIGESHAAAVVEETKQETHLDTLDNPPVFVGYQSFDYPGINNKERRSWFVKVLTPREYRDMQEKALLEEASLGINRQLMSRDEHKAALFKIQHERKDGSGEVRGTHAFSFEEILHAPTAVDKASPFAGQMTHFLTVTETYQGKEDKVNAFLSPGSTDSLLFPENRELWDAIQRTAHIPLVQSWTEALKLLENAPRRNLYSIQSEGFIFRGVYGQKAFEDIIKSSLVRTNNFKNGGWWGDLFRAFFWATGGGRNHVPGLLLRMPLTTLETHYQGLRRPPPVDISDVPHAYLMMIDSQSTDKAIEDSVRMVEVRLPGMNSNSAQAALAERKGGIDLSANKIEIRNSGQSIQIKMDPAMMQELRNAPGFVPVIITIQPLTDLRKFLGLPVSPSHP